MPPIQDLTLMERVNTLPAPLTARLDALVLDALLRVFPALALAVIHEGDIRLNAAWGWIDAEARRIPARPDTLFDLASVTKLFTSTAFLTFVEAGTVRLDDPLVSLVPEFARVRPRALDGGQDPHTRAMLPLPDSARGRTVDPRAVTFRHLLAHTSGLAPWRDVYRSAGPPPVPPGEVDPVSRHERWARALDALCLYPFVGAPETDVRYSDLGIMLLGEATARLNDTPGMVDPAVQSRVLDPLGLGLVYNPARAGRSRQDIAPTEDDATWRKRRAWGEVHDENAAGLGGVAGHAGLFGTARDVAAFGQAWLQDDARLGLSPALMDEARREQAWTGVQRRGLGWRLMSPDDSPAGTVFSAASYGHTGFTGTSLWIDPERRLVIACLANSVYYRRLSDGISEFRRALHDLLAAGLT